MRHNPSLILLSKVELWWSWLIEANDRCVLFESTDVDEVGTFIKISWIGLKVGCRAKELESGRRRDGRKTLWNPV